MADSVIYRVVLAPNALKTVRGVLNRRLSEQLIQYLNSLQSDAEEKGGALVGELKGYRCLRPEGGWFCIVYRVVTDRVEVVLVSVGQARPTVERDMRDLARILFSQRLLVSVYPSAKPE